MEIESLQQQGGKALLGWKGFAQHGINRSAGTVDIRVRVEVRNEVMEGQSCTI